MARALYKVKVTDDTHTGEHQIMEDVICITGDGNNFILHIQEGLRIRKNKFEWDQYSYKIWHHTAWKQPADKDLDNCSIWKKIEVRHGK